MITFFFQAHGRPTLKNLVQAWNKMLQKELEHTPTVKTDAAAAFLASLEDPKLTSLGEAPKKPPIEILPPGMASLSAPPITTIKKPTGASAAAASAGAQNTTQQQPAKPLMLEAPPAEHPDSNPPASEPSQPATEPTPVPEPVNDPPVPEPVNDPTPPTQPDAPSEGAEAPPLMAENMPQVIDMSYFKCMVDVAVIKSYTGEYSFIPHSNCRDV